MSSPFSGIPDPGMPRPPIRRRQPGVVEEKLRAFQQKAKASLRAAQPKVQEAIRGAQRYSERLWFRGKRNPRTVAAIGLAIAVTLGGAYAVSASGVGDSRCSSAGKSSASKTRQAPPFVLLMDRVPQAQAGSEIEIPYDVCGLRSGTPYTGRVRLSRQPAPGKKQKVKPRPLVVTFRHQADGLATRHSQQLDLGTIKPGTYTLELLVVDNQGRQRKRLQKVVVKAQ